MLNQYIVGALLMVSLFGCQAGMPVAQQSKPQMDKSYTWFDGERHHKVWLNPNEIAEFSSDEGQQNPGMNRRSLIAGMILLKKQGNLRIWQVPEKEVEPSTGIILRAVQQPGHTIGFSEVFHATTATHSPRMALPGNVIVAFSESWNLQQAGPWFEAKGLKVLKPVIEEQGIFLVKSESGLASLTLANELNKANEVRYAMPNWWKETFKR